MPPIVAVVERFSAVYFKPRQRQSPNDHQLMNAALDPCVVRFKELQQEKPDEAELWRGKLMAFCSLYGFLSQIIPYQDTDLERLYVFLRHLATKLPKRGAGPSYQFDDEVRLEYYRLQKIMNDKSFQLLLTRLLSEEVYRKLTKAEVAIPK